MRIARWWPVVVAMFAVHARANQPPPPKPLPPCEPGTTKQVKLFSCPGDTIAYTACPKHRLIELAGTWVDMDDPILEWCMPAHDDGRSVPGADPFQGGSIAGEYGAWYSDGQKAEEGTVPARNTTWTRWHKNGVKAFVRSYNARGETTEWYDNGQKRLSGTYVQSSTRVDKWTWWWPNGKVQSTVSYVADREEGPWITYYDNGQQASVRDYRNGRHTGRWREWYRDGSKKIEATCNDYTLVGRYRSWNPDGSVKIDSVQHGASCS